MDDIKIQKRDETIEEYDRSKIQYSLIKAGASPEDAEKTISTIEAWLPTAVLDGLINHKEVRTKVIEVMQSINHTAAANYERYRKPGNHR